MSLPPAEAFEDFVAKAREANTHPAKLLVLSEMMKSVFGVQVEDLIPGIETKLGSRILGLRGSADLIFSNVIFELKVDLKREEEDAKTQIWKYFQALQEKYPGMRYIAIATDCTVFKAFSPVSVNGVVSGVKEISALDVSKSSAADSILWLDAFIFSKPKIRPSAEDLKWRFGVISPTYSLSIDVLKTLWLKVREEPDVKLKLDLWSRNLEIVYGKAPQEDSFVEHTYLVTLVKLVVYLRLSGDSIARRDRIASALSGEYFSSYGIMNLIEEDFFSWLMHPLIKDDSVSLSHGLANELLRYDFSQIDEDFFKEIYQDVVDRGQRHRIGEYYTPEWLTELTLQEATKVWSTEKGKLPSILDAFSGSGTFLSAAIRLLRNELAKKGSSKPEALEVILSKVVGMDINPLAVIIGRANYLIALGDLLMAGKSVTIPDYVADSIKIPEVETMWEYQANQNVEVYDFEAYGFHIQIPTRVAKDRSLLGVVMDGFREGIENYRSTKAKTVATKVFERNASTTLTLGELEVFKRTFNDVLSLIDKGEDSIWVFIINNMYAPIALMESKFDILVSNPPWIAMRYLENKNYQNFLKEQVFNYRLLEKSQVKLFTQMEAATLCYCRACDLYLKEDGVISFVMPRSVLTGAFHHDKFRSFQTPLMKLEKILDLEDVSPLFNVPACVLISTKGVPTTYPVFARSYSGKLERKNVRLDEAKGLVIHDYNYEPPRPSGKVSPYHDLVRQGATIVPRSLWFVDFEVQDTLGITNMQKPKVKTSVEIANESKEPWRGIQLEGNVEADYIYCTILGGDLVPFGVIKFRPVVLPLEPRTTSYVLLDTDGLRNRSLVHAEKWLEMAQKEWEERRTEKSAESFDRLIRWLDYQGKATNQNPSSKYVLLYNTSGTNLVSYVLSRQELPAFRANGVSISPKGFIAESTTYSMETNHFGEAHYISATLNSTIVNQAIKPFQPRGLFGERHIHRRPFMLPIPKFNEKNSIHQRLAELSLQAHVKVAKVQWGKMSPGRARSRARDIASKELQEIDRLVSKMLGV